MKRLFLDKKINDQTDSDYHVKGWRLLKLDDVAVNIVGGGTPDTKNAEYWDGDIPWITSAHITGREVTTGQKFITKKGLSNSASNIVPKDNFLVSTRVGIGKSAVNKLDIAISQDLTGVVVDKSKVTPDYLYRVFCASERKLKSLAQGSTIKGILREALGKLELPIPSLSEQQKIAEILLAADEAIEKTDEAIKRMQRIKDGMMCRLLTKGIGHKEFKKSDWGEIPVEWQIATIAEITEVKGGKRLPKGHQLVDTITAFPYIRVVDFESMSVTTADLKYLLPETQLHIKRYTISTDDVYISIAGTVGAAGIIPIELNGANLTENAAKLCNLRKVSKYYLAYILNSFIGQQQIDAYVGKATQPKLALFRIEKIKIPLPSPAEQQEIVEILGAIDKKILLLKDKKKRFERIKQSLMNDLLTGKKRVVAEA
jgi:type I restriction enzyme, S subunit